MPQDQTTYTRKSGGRLVKSGPRVEENKFHALIFAHGEGVPVPIAHQWVMRNNQNTHSLGIDFVEGDVREHVWHFMSEGDKLSIARQLGRILLTMRSYEMKKPDHFSIGVAEGPARDSRRFDIYEGGPFENEADFNDFVLTVYSQCPQPIYESLAAKMRTDHLVYFTHADLSPRNIIIQDGKIKALVEWDFAGFYPENWEYVKFFDCLTNCKDWKNYANVIFETSYPDELVLHQAILRWQKA